MATGTRAAGRRILAERAMRADGGAGNARGGAHRTVTVNLAESPLCWLHARGHVSARQLDAGELLRRDWERAGLAPQVTMNWLPTARAGTRRRIDPAEATIAQINAKQRFQAAIEAAGPGLSDILWRVVCAGEGLVAAERDLGWPARAGKLVLGLALDRIADFYRLAGGNGKAAPRDKSGSAAGSTTPRA
jgi:hypothetical protein